jgi:hypothetical protein
MRPSSADTSTEQSGYLHAGQGVTIDIINEQQNILMLDITEIFSHCQAS